MKTTNSGGSALNYTLSLFVALSFYSSLVSAGGKGEALFKLCSTCHGNQGEGRQDLDAPAIAGLPSWYTKKQLEKFSNGKRGKHAKDIAGMRMRPMARTLASEKEMQAVADYVAGLKRVKTKNTITGDKAKGQARFAACITCHGADGMGNQAFNAPPLKGINDWYMLTQLKKF